jgi:ribosome-associated protein
MQKIDFELRGEFITLDRLLKATGLASSGGQARALVTDGRVQVDGQDELRKTAKLRAGQVVSITGVRIRLLPPAAEAAGADDVPGPAEGPGPQ